MRMAKTRKDKKALEGGEEEESGRKGEAAPVSVSLLLKPACLRPF